jgi:hypothetical protein
MQSKLSSKCASIKKAMAVYNGEVERLAYFNFFVYVYTVYAGHLFD